MSSASYDRELVCNKIRVSIRKIIDIYDHANYFRNRDELVNIKKNATDLYNVVLPLRSQLILLDVDTNSCELAASALEGQEDNFERFFWSIDRLHIFNGALSRILYSNLSPNHPESPPALPSLPPLAVQENQRRAALEAFSGKSTTHSYPWIHLISPSDSCNLRCITCHQSSNQNFLRADLQDIDRRALATAVPFATQVYVGGTGEPLLSPSAVELIRQYSEVGAEVGINTNGTLSERLAQVAPNLAFINLSFDGGTAKTFEAIRAGASFSKILAGIEALPPTERRKFNLNVVVTRFNHHEISEILAIARSLGVGNVSFQEFHPYLPWHSDMILRPQDRARFFQELDSADSSQLSITVNLAREAAGQSESSDKSLEGLTAEIAKAIPEALSLQQIEDNIGTLTEAVLDYLAILQPALLPVSAKAPSAPRPLADLVSDLQLKIAHGTAASPSCFAQFSTLYLQSNGSLRPCCVLRTQVGNLADAATFAEIWNSPTFTAFREGIQGERPPHPACADCRDGVRFNGLSAMLRHLEEMGIDISRLPRPSVPLPDSLTSDAFVSRWGLSTAD